MNQKDGNSKLDWMYKGANSLIDQEEYLLGKSVDKSLEQLNKEEKDKRVGIVAPNNHVEHECIPPSIRDFNKIVQAEQVDLSAKLQEDPLVAIRKQEEEARRQFLQNPVQLKKLQDALKSQELKKKNKKNKKSKKSKVDLDKQLLKLLKNGQGSMRFPEIQGKRKKSGDLDTILIHKLSMFRDKLSQKEVDDIIAGKLSDDELTKIEKSSDCESDDKKTHKSLMSQERNIKNEKKSKYNERNRKKGASKYTHKRNKSSSSEESDEYDRKRSKFNKKPKIKKNRRSSSKSEDENKAKYISKGGSKYISKRTPSSSSDESDEYDMKKSKSSREPQSRKSRRSNRSGSRGDRNREKDGSKYNHKRTHSSSSEDSDNYNRSKGKSTRDLLIERNHRRSSRSIERSKRRNVDKVSSTYRRTQSSSSEESEECDRKKGKSSRDLQNKNTRSGSDERSKREDTRNKHSEDKKSDVRERKYGQSEPSNNSINKDKPLESRKSDLDRLISEKLKMLRNSLPDKSETIPKEKSDEESVQYDSENDRYVAKKKNFGLVRPDGTKIPLKGTSLENKTKEPAKKSEAPKKPDVKKNKRLTEEEKEKLRKQMMADATEREVERSENLKRYRQEDEKEQHISEDFDKNFMHKELLRSTTNATVETRLKSNLNNIQRSAQHMNSNFSKR